MRSNMGLRLMLVSGAGLFAVVAAARSQGADQPVGQDAEAAHQVESDHERRDWHLDPAIFTDILPVNSPDVAVKLPEDQREEP